MSLTKTDQAKSKDRASRQYPIDFVVPLQLEECVHRIEHHFTHTTDIDVRIINQANDDAATFVLSLRDERSYQFVVTISGTMYRWEGTSTRFEGKLDKQSSAKAEKSPWIMQYPPLTVILSLGLLIIVCISLTILIESVVTSSEWVALSGTCLMWISAWGLIQILTMLYHFLPKYIAQRRLIGIFVERLTRIPSQYRVL